MPLTFQLSVVRAKFVIKLAPKMLTTFDRKTFLNKRCRRRNIVNSRKFLQHWMFRSFSVLLRKSVRKEDENIYWEQVLMSMIIFLVCGSHTKDNQFHKLERKTEPSIESRFNSYRTTKYPTKICSSQTKIKKIPQRAQNISWIIMTKVPKITFLFMLRPTSTIFQTFQIWRLIKKLTKALFFLLS